MYSVCVCVCSSVFSLLAQHRVYFHVLADGGIHGKKQGGGTWPRAGSQLILHIGFLWLHNKSPQI